MASRPKPSPVKPPKKTLLTGFPEHFTARRLLAELLGADSDDAESVLQEILEAERFLEAAT